MDVVTVDLTMVIKVGGAIISCLLELCFIFFLQVTAVTGMWLWVASYTDLDVCWKLHLKLLLIIWVVTSH